MPLISALKLRRSTREFSEWPLPTQVLSDLLWAAFGVNRPDGGRTAPYWRHVMVIDIYAVMANGVWLYEPGAHTLLPYLPGDIRAATGLQDFAAKAPLNLVYVAHSERMQDASRKTGVFTPRSTRDLSGRTSICSAPRKGWRPCFEEP